jgi:trigger factor
MQVSVEASTGLERRVTVTVAAERINSAIDKKIKETAKSIRLDGFRKGKVPAKVVKKRYGASIRQEILGDVIQTSYVEALQEEKINPVGMPEIEPKEDTGQGDFSYTATVEIYPEISLADASALNIERQAGNIVDVDVRNMIEMLRKQRCNWVEVVRAAADGDQVNVDFEGAVDGEVFDGGEEQGHDLVLGSGSMMPGFEEGIIGMSSGEVKDLTVTFPENYRLEHLAGREAIFKITVHKVSEAVLPSLNDEFFAEFSPQGKGEAGFEVDIRTNMEREMTQALKTKLKNTVLDAYVELNGFDVPKSLVKEELGRLKQQAIQRFGGDNQNLDPSVLPDEMFQDEANKRVKTGLLVGEVIKCHEMSADEDKVKTLVEGMAQGYEDPEQFIDYYLNNAERRSQLEGVVLEDMVVEHLLAAGNVTDLEVDYKTAVEPQK